MADIKQIHKKAEGENKILGGSAASSNKARFERKLHVKMQKETLLRQEERQKNKN